MNFYNEKQQQYSNYKIAGTLHGLIINAEFSLQSVSQNSRENNQRQSWSQIREKWAMFVIRCYRKLYVQFASFRSLFYPFLTANPLS